MKAKELRFGNMVKVTKAGGWDGIGSIITVESITEYGINHWRDMGASGYNSFDGICGVELTCEVLEKIGLVKENRHDDKDMWAFTKGKYDIIHTVDNGETFYLPAFDEPTIKYVHQLQNIYFDLSGLEL